MLEIILRPNEMPSQEAIRYNPARDFAYLYPQLVRQAAVFLEKGNWAEFREVFPDLTEEDMVPALEALSRFFHMAKQDFNKSAVTCAQESGMDDVDPRARVALQAVIGQILVGATFYCVREMTPGGPETCLNSASELSRVAFSYGRYIGLPAWRKWLLNRCPSRLIRNWYRRRYAEELRSQLGADGEYTVPTGL